MLLQISSLKTNHFWAVAAKFFVVPIKRRFELLMVGNVTKSSVRLFHVGTTLFEKKFCLTETDWEKSFLSFDLKDFLRSLNELPLTPDDGLVRSLFLVKSGGLTKSIFSRPFCTLNISIRSLLKLEAESGDLMLRAELKARRRMHASNGTVKYAFSVSLNL